MAATKPTIHKTRLRVGDLVQVITGKDAAGRKRQLGEGDDPRDRGRRGKIVSLDLRKGTAIVQGCRIVYKHQKSNDPNQPSPGRIEKEAGIPLSNLMVVDPETDVPTRIGVRETTVTLANGKTKTRRIRIAKKSGVELPEKRK